MDSSSVMGFRVLRGRVLGRLKKDGLLEVGRPPMARTLPLKSLPNFHANEAARMTDCSAAEQDMRPSA